LGLSPAGWDIQLLIDPRRLLNRIAGGVVFMQFRGIDHGLMPAICLTMATTKYVGSIISLLLLFSSCATTMRTDLYFGLSMPGGGQVTPEQWQRFSDSIVSPRFPEGYTEVNVAGKWRDTESHLTITENTKMLTFIGKKSKSRQVNLDSLIHIYKRQYQQQAILRTDAKVRLRFIER
jgi:hypothetical protein